MNRLGAVWLIFLGLVLSSQSFGQTMTATITDSDSQTWNNGSYAIQLVSSSGASVPQGQASQIDTGATVTTTTATTALDGTGSLSVTLVANSNINPSGTKWQFRICSNTIPQSCGSTSLTITGSGSISTQLSAAITAPRIGGGTGTQGYADVEANAVNGNTYYNVTSSTQRCYAASAWGTCGSGGGSGTVTTFSAGTLSPLFTTSVATATTTPALSFSLSNAVQNSVLAGPASGGTGSPSYQTAPTISAANMTNFPTFTCSQITNCPTSSAAVQTLIGNGVYVPVGGYYGGTATGSVNALAITLNTGLGTPTLTNLIGIPITFIPNLANTTNAPTLTVNSLAATNIVKGTSTVLAAGDIALTPTTVIYNGTNFVLMNPQVVITQTGSSGNFAVNSGSGTLTANTIAPSASTGQNQQLGAAAAASASAGSNTFLVSASNSSSGSAGNTEALAGKNTGTGQQGWVNIQQSFTIAAATTIGHVMQMTSTVDRVVDAALGSVNNVGVAAGVGGTAAQIYVATEGKALVMFDGTPVVGDEACAPTTGTGTIGLAHDNVLLACPAGQKLGIITGQVSGTGSGATATVLLQLGS